jgi:hypothetical protein
MGSTSQGRTFGKVPLEEDRLAYLVLIGVLPDGTKEVIAIQDGYQDSRQSS